LCRQPKGCPHRITIPQNKFKVLLSRVMQCGKGGKMIRKQEIVVIEYFKYREKGHKYREYSK